MTDHLKERIRLYANQATDDLFDAGLLADGDVWEKVEAEIAEALTLFIQSYEQMRADGLIGPRVGGE